MRYVLMMRHANAAFPDPGMTDYDRPLTDLGRVEARTTAAELAAVGLTPDLVLCSPARRAAETLETVSPILGIDSSDVRQVGELYSGGPETYVETAKQAHDNRVTMLIGHNPMLEDAAISLSEDGNEDDIALLRNGMPTGAIAVLRITGANGSTRSYLERLIVVKQ
ncbi:MAG: histidine phosphatase family protein [Rhizobiaceae bacterium]|nr:histidine phosphatase family protein [Rhizobiaceae bacterium]